MAEKHYMSVRRLNQSKLYTSIGVPIELAIDMGITSGSVVTLEQKDNDTIEVKIVDRKASKLLQ